MIKLDTAREAGIADKLLSRQNAIVLDTAGWVKRAYADDSLLVQHVDAILADLKGIDLHTDDPFAFDGIAEMLNEYTGEDTFDNEVWMLISLQDNYRFWHHQSR